MRARLMIGALAAIAVVVVAAFYLVSPKEQPAFDKLGMLAEINDGYQGVQTGHPLADLFGDRSQ